MDCQNEFIDVFEDFSLVYLNELNIAFLHLGTCLVRDGHAESKQTKDEGRNCKLHSFKASLHEDLFELQEECVPHVVVLRLNQMDQLCNRVLPFFKLVWVFFRGGILFVLQEGHDEFDQLVDGVCVGERMVILQDRLHNFKSDCSFVAELHVLHQGWVMVHTEHFD